MKTLEEKAEAFLADAVEKTKQQLYKDFCNATDKESQEEARLMTNALPKLVQKLKRNYNKG